MDKQVWIEILNSDYQPLPVSKIYSVENATYKRQLDRIGTFNIRLVGNDKEAYDNLSIGTYIRLMQTLNGNNREVFKGIIKKRTISANSSDKSIVITGNDILELLNNKVVFLGRSYNNQNAGVIASDLISLTSLSLNYESGLPNQTVRFDGATVLKCLQRMCKESGFHFRLDSSSNTVKLGYFGQNSGLEIRQSVGGVPVETYSNNDLFLVESIRYSEDDSEYYNWIMPLGAGAGSTVQTLRESTRTSPYTINSFVGTDGSTQYYLTTESNTNLQKQYTASFKDIGAISNSDSAKTLAANALYDAAANWLEKHSVIKLDYDVKIEKVNTTVNLGDLIRLVYRGEVNSIDGTDFRLIDVDDSFYINEIHENFSIGGYSVNLVLSNVDRNSENLAERIIGAVESIKASEVSVQSFPVLYMNTDQDTIQGFGLTTDRSYKEAEFTIKFDEAITDIISVTIEFESRPLYSLTSFDDFSAVYNSPFFSYIYQVFKDDNYPQGVSIFINGIDRTTELGGKWGTTTTGFNVTKDITNYLNEASGGIYQTHTIKFSCENATGNAAVLPAATWNDLISHGWIRLTTRVLGVARAVVPKTT